MTLDNMPWRHDVFILAIIFARFWRCQRNLFRNYKESFITANKVMHSLRGMLLWKLYVSHSANIGLYHLLCQKVRTWSFNMLYYLLNLICKYKNNGAVQELYEHTSYMLRNHKNIYILIFMTLMVYFIWQQWRGINCYILAALWACYWRLAAW